MVISGYLEDKLNQKRKRDAARRKAEEEKRIAEAVSEAVTEAVSEAMEVARAEAKETRARALAEAHRSWTDWNRRRMEADEVGEPFDEAPPEFPQHTGEPR